MATSRLQMISNLYIQAQTCSYLISLQMYRALAHANPAIKRSIPCQLRALAEREETWIKHTSKTQIPTKVTELRLLSSSAKAAKKHREAIGDRRIALDEVTPVGRLAGQDSRASRSGEGIGSSYDGVVETAIPIRPQDAFQLSSSAKAVKTSRQGNISRREALGHLEGRHQGEGIDLGISTGSSSYDAIVHTAITIKPTDAFQLSSSAKAAKKSRQEQVNQLMDQGADE
ncbi:hypothetical protein H109_07548 [Trichophyton interdigitale MR816]|uniref:Uncharacterized protein n=1 Tax=Trichophyton interdigitale (strain MR816) TaxID=1215338 RepID=A0A059IYG0_TRIIM|nr:hypothetical protein H101_02970 [Trichophyton interdigitale H6]KDB20493.1 hypothetical protein H109_07548 [Trichophyton interdigitale MR816]